MTDQIRDERLASQLLSGAPASSVAAVVQHLLAVQAQDLQGARLAVRARTEGLTVRDFDAALANRSLVISWLCRGSLHLVTADDYFWLHDLTSPPLRPGCLRRLVQEGVPPEQAAQAGRLIARWLADDGPLTRDELADRLRSRQIPVAGQAVVHILFHATLEGLIIRGPMKGRRQAFVLAHDWLGPRPPVRDRGQALAELVRRYLIGHAPASERDIARWAGLPLRDIRAGLDGLGAQLQERGEGFLALGERPRVPGAPPARLLGAFDPLLVGWKDRTFVTGERDADVISGGLFRPFMLANGSAGGVWRLDGREVVVEAFEPMSEAGVAALERDAEDVRRYLRLGGPSAPDPGEVRDRTQRQPSPAPFALPRASGDRSTDLSRNLAGGWIEGDLPAVQVDRPLGGDQGPDAVGQVLVVGHRAIIAPRLKSGFPQGLCGP